MHACPMPCHLDAQMHVAVAVGAGRCRQVLTPRLVHVQVAQDDGSLMSCALNATCAALVDAGVAMTKLLGGWQLREHMSTPSSCSRAEGLLAWQACC
jgi:hypothetical protein